MDVDLLEGLVAQDLANVRGRSRPEEEMLEIVGSLGTFSITWEDVHHKWCIPLWNAFAKKVGIEIEVTPGETCRVALKK